MVASQQIEGVDKGRTMRVGAHVHFALLSPDSHHLSFFINHRLHIENSPDCN